MPPSGIASRSIDDKIDDGIRKLCLVGVHCQRFAPWLELELHAFTHQSAQT